MNFLFHSRLPAVAMTCIHHMWKGRISLQEDRVHVSPVPKLAQPPPKKKRLNATIFGFFAETFETFPDLHFRGFFFKVSVRPFFALTRCLPCPYRRRDRRDEMELEYSHRRSFHGWFTLAKRTAKRIQKNPWKQRCFPNSFWESLAQSDMAKMHAKELRIKEQKRNKEIKGKTNKKSQNSPS